MIAGGKQRNACVPMENGHPAGEEEQHQHQPLEEERVFKDAKCFFHGHVFHCMIVNPNCICIYSSRLLNPALKEELYVRSMST